MTHHANHRIKQLNFRSECEAQVKGYSGAAYKKFKSLKEAEEFVDGQPQSKRMKTSDEPAKSPINYVALGKLLKDKNKINFAENFKKGLKKAQMKSSTDAIEIEDSSSESDMQEREKAFLDLPEYDSDEKAAATTSTSAQSSSTDLTKVKAKPPEPTTLQKVGLSRSQFHVDAQGFVHVYTDGACENNGRYTARAGLGVYFGDGHLFNTSKPVKGRPTNNCGEIQAAIEAIKIAQLHQIQRLRIFTDSQFLINSACFWIKNWKQKGWKLSTGKSVVNKRDFMKLDELIEKGDMVIEWRYIPAHKGHHGNEEADKLAKEGASNYMTKREKAEFGDARSSSDSDSY